MALINFLGGLLTGQRIAAQRVFEKKEDDPEASMYLYGTPSESGNIGLRSGDSVSYYDGMVTPPIDTVYTSKLKAEYPYAVMIRQKWSGALGAHDSVSVICAKSQFKANADGYLASLYGQSIVVFEINYLNGETDWSEPVVDGDGDYYFTAEIMWGNHDILNANGGVFLAKSAPIPVYTGVVAYSYNGIIRPPKPEYDETVYPYAFYDNIANNYFACKSVSFGVDADGTRKKLILGEHKMYPYAFAKWANPMTDPDGMVWFSFIKWADFDVLNPTDNTVYLAASEPIPVYE